MTLHGYTPLHTHTHRSWWSGVEQGPPDAIFGLVEAHKKDPRPEKVNLAIGAYRDSDGKPLVLNTVRKVGGWSLAANAALLVESSSSVNGFWKTMGFNDASFLHGKWRPSTGLVQFLPSNMVVVTMATCKTSVN